MSEPTECGRKFSFADYRCRRLLNGDGSDHLGLHRNARTARFATVMWGDNECAPPQESAPAAPAPAAAAEHPEEPQTAARDWHRTARVRLTRDYTAGNAYGDRGAFKAGAELTMYQWGRAGRRVDRAWWTSFDIDGAFIIPPDAVEILAITEDVPPTDAPEEQPARAGATEATYRKEGQDG